MQSHSFETTLVIFDGLFTSILRSKLDRIYKVDLITVYINEFSHTIQPSYNVTYFTSYDYNLIDPMNEVIRFLESPYSQQIICDFDLMPLD